LDGHAIEFAATENCGGPNKRATNGSGMTRQF